MSAIRSPPPPDLSEEKAMEITRSLLDTLSDDAAVRTEADNRLNQSREKNLPGYLLSLSVELSDDTKPIESRRLAVIALQNSLDAKDAFTKQLLNDRWLSIHADIRSRVKNLLLNTLGSSVRASQVIGKIASIEIPLQQWPELIGCLLGNMNQQQDRPLRLGTVETLGFVCEEESCCDSFLQYILPCMKVTEQDPEVRHAAVNALFNALLLEKASFKHPDLGEPDIMMAVLEAAAADASGIRQMAFRCLATIAAKYYEVLAIHYARIFLDRILELTRDAIRDEDAIAVEAINFWLTLCKMETELGLNENYHLIDMIYPKLFFLLMPLIEEIKSHEEEIKSDEEEKPWKFSVVMCWVLMHKKIRCRNPDKVLKCVKNVMAQKDLNIVIPQNMEQQGGITKLLLDAQSADAHVRSAAENRLYQLQQEKKTCLVL